ncbi:hypothetical protein FNV43_RR16814 [Rhamnella rubrinervis]|uniref:Uncharacterized protein n=1 Tax=Rhamnella rubrinervis TaxID=2594499 RepID=A0A8K0MDV4_9ROSA|nr:hypothetical protein FNV43_RR16814 [Rhamnella rubrinervis]
MTSKDPNSVFIVNSIYSLDEGILVRPYHLEGEGAEGQHQCRSPCDLMIDAIKAIDDTFAGVNWDRSIDLPWSSTSVDSTIRDLYKDVIDAGFDF